MRQIPHFLPALVTPFDDDGEIDLDAHGHNVALLSAQGVSGFLLGGSTGEGTYLEPGDRRQLIETARDAAPKAHLMAGIAAETTRAGLRQIEETREADSLLVLTPTTMARGRSEAVARYYREMAADAGIPVLLYSVPTYTAYNLPEEVVADLALVDGIVGMKDSSGDILRIQRILASTPDDFAVFSGASQAAATALLIGCHGLITASGNYAPDMLLEMIELADDNSTALHQLQRQLTTLVMAIETHGVPGVKAAAAATGLTPGHPRKPLQHVGADVAESIGQILDNL